MPADRPLDQSRLIDCMVAISLLWLVYILYIITKKLIAAACLVRRFLRNALSLNNTELPSLWFVKYVDRNGEVVRKSTHVSLGEPRPRRRVGRGGHRRDGRGGRRGGA